MNKSISTAASCFVEHFLVDTSETKYKIFVPRNVIIFQNRKYMDTCEKNKFSFTNF